MKKKAHGTSDFPVQSNLKYGCDVALADRICNFNRRFAEHAGEKKNKKIMIVDRDFSEDRKLDKNKNKFPPLTARKVKLKLNGILFLLSFP
jgi:hypothetical protein